MKIDENMFNRNKMRSIEEMSLINESFNDLNTEFQGVMGDNYGPWDETNSLNTLENIIK